MVLVEATRVLGLGAAIGAVGGIAAARLLRTQLFGVAPLDPFAWIAAAFILAACGWGASWVPARRATPVDPAVTLRAE